ncbi:fimbrial protein [Erwinia rhapontici]|uniref:CS1 type fimbrial major subunit n=1 Tax=Erwinia rhapontici TaxID=55212 RepID=UPI001D0D944C|nr:CS1 type fimbrial major subunit [Erwinia rhapontici]UDQ80057.1 fimbrial protein [Erwinia rhapontici]
MKLSNIALAMAMTLFIAGAAHAATTADSVSKKITLTAQINDGMFVSKPDGSSWYNTEELEATDYKQKSFSKVLPVRVWTKNADFNISLSQDLKLAGPNYEMLNPKVTFGSGQGDLELKTGAAQKVTQVVKTDDGYDGVYNLTVKVDAPATPGAGKPSLNGSYSGDLVMLFEPSTASE